MSTSSNIASEIDAIIARAMEEYRNAKGEDAFAEVETPAEESVIREEPEPEHPEIPVNSQSILVSEETSRFSGAVWFDNIQTKQVTLAGVGGIGSYVTFLLSRLHPQALYIYDDDNVEAANMSGQLYSTDDIGSAKVNAMVRMAGQYSSYYDIFTYNERFNEHSTATKIMICGFDNMVARRDFFNAWKALVQSLPEQQRKECLFIDGRLAAESFQVLCIRGDDTFNMNRYEDKFLFRDSEAEETLCSYKQTTFMANMIGSVMVNLFVNFCANECNPLIPRDLPFFTEYSADTMFFKVVS